MEGRSIRIGKIGEDPNPWIYVKLDTVGTPLVEYVIASENPDEEAYLPVVQFCALLSLYWLRAPTDGRFGIGDFSDPDKIRLAGILIDNADQRLQVAYVEKNLPGRARDLAALEKEQAGYPPGTRIWAGSERHVVAVDIADGERFRLYDPDTGTTEAYDRGQLVGLLKARDCTVFVVRVAAR